MKKIKEYMPYIAMVFVIICIGGCSLINNYFGWEDDNPGEELVEEIIKAKTGIDLDLTP